MIRYRFNRGRCFEVRWEMLILWENIYLRERQKPKI